MQVGFLVNDHTPGTLGKIGTLEELIMFYFDPKKKEIHSETLNEISGLNILTDEECRALTDSIIKFEPEFDLCAGRKEIIKIHAEPVFKVSNL